MKSFCHKSYHGQILRGYCVCSFAISMLSSGFELGGFEQSLCKILCYAVNPYNQVPPHNHQHSQQATLIHSNNTSCNITLCIMSHRHYADVTCMLCQHYMNVTLWL